MTATLLFISTFGLVFFLGLQSLNVNGGHYLAAFFTSFGIGIGNMVLYKLAPNANSLEILAYLMGGPFGIVASMAAHRRFIRRKEAPVADKVAPPKGPAVYGTLMDGSASRPSLLGMPKPHIFLRMSLYGGTYWVCKLEHMVGVGDSIAAAYGAFSREQRIARQTRRGT